MMINNIQIWTSLGLSGRAEKTVDGVRLRTIVAILPRDVAHDDENATNLSKRHSTR